MVMGRKAHIIPIGFISYINIYNMSVWLFILIKNIKAKVVSWVEYSTFVYFLHSRRGWILFWRVQQNLFLFGERFSTRIAIIHVSNVEMTLRNRNFHTILAIYSCWIIQLFKFISSWISIKCMVVYNFTAPIQFINMIVIVM